MLLRPFPVDLDMGGVPHSESDLGGLVGVHPDTLKAGHALQGVIKLRVTAAV